MGELGADFTIAYLPRGNTGWVTMGTCEQGHGIYPEDPVVTAEDQGGAATLTATIKGDARRIRKDLEQFTPIMYYEAGRCKWSGRLIRTPTQASESEESWSLEAQGWREHLTDWSIDKLWVHTDLTAWKDLRSASNASLLVTAAHSVGNVSVGDGIIALSNPDAVPVSTLGYHGVFLDLGPNNTAARVIVTYTSSNNSANQRLVLLGCTTDSPNSGTTSSIQTATNNAGASGTLRSTPSGSRYVHIYNQVTTGYTPTADVWFRITSVQVFTDAADESGDASILRASTVIGETLTERCPLLSSDQSLIEETDFDIHEFHTGLARKMYPNEIKDGVNAYHLWQFQTTNEYPPRPVYRPVPSQIAFVLGIQDPYYFQNPSTNDGSKVFNRITGQYTDASGVPGYVSAIVPTTTPALKISDVQLSNPSATTNTTDWTAPLYGSVNRDTDAGDYDSTPAGFRLDPTGADHYSYTETWTGNLVPGRTYRIHLAYKNPAGGQYTMRVSSYGVTNTASGLPGYLGAATLTSTTWSTQYVDFVADGTAVRLSFYTPAAAGGSLYVDTISLFETVGNVIERRGFVKEGLMDFRSKLPEAAAQQLAQMRLDASQRPPLAGTITLTQSHIRQYPDGEWVHVSELLDFAGYPILIEDMQDSDTGAYGRIGTIKRVERNKSSETVQIVLDNSDDYIDAVQARVGAILGPNN